MKKSLFALAALGAFAGAAQAQSSVTLYGNIDASIQAIQNGGIDRTNSTLQGGGTTATAPGGALTSTGNNSSYGNANPITGSASPAFVDGAVATSLWGMKGTEDLGGGMKANFYLAGDANTNNGGTNYDGLFRRGAWLGLSGGFGEVRLGTQANPIATASASLMPVMGNTVGNYRGIYTHGKDFNRNAIGYLTPVFGGFGAELQYAANNTIDGGYSDGTIVNLRAFYNVGNLDITAAYLKAASMSATGNAAAGTCTTNATSLAITCAAANYSGDTTGYLAGVKYKVTPAVQLGLGWAHGENDATNFYAGTPSTAATSSTAIKSSANVFMAGVGYQATPAVLLGLNYLVNTADSSMYNFQTCYALSKRTTAYAQVTMLKNGAGCAIGTAGTCTVPYGNSTLVGGQTNNSPSVQVQGMAALPNTTQTAYGVGIIHNF